MSGIAKQEKLIINKKSIKAGRETEVYLHIGELPSRTPINIPVIINRAKKEGPVLLLLGGLHGDELNGIEIVRRIVEQNLHIPESGTIITMPVLNIFGFINYSREVPDGKDVNRSFPGTKSGSLASRMAYHLMKQIIPHIDFGIDFHTGGDSRSNYPQIRCELSDPRNRELATAFNAPFTIHSKHISKSLRHAAYKKGKNILVYEGGESLRFDEFAIKTALDGYKRFLWKMGMGPQPETENNEEPTVFINKMKWLRATGAGLFRPFLYNGSKVKKGDLLGNITGPFGDYEMKITSPTDGFIVGINNNPVVNVGDALIHLGLIED